MLKVTMITTIALTSLFSNAAELRCSDKITEVLNIYRAKNTDCRDFDDQNACDNICQTLESSSAVVSSGGCNPSDIELAKRDAERETLRRIRQDFGVEGTARAAAVGSTEQDCLNNANLKAQGRASDAIGQCNSRTTYFKNCEISGNRVVEVPQKFYGIKGIGAIDEKKIDETLCKRKAEQMAQDYALSECRKISGTECRISSGPTSATYQTKQRRRYGIMGPKETYHICNSTAEALPDSSAQFRCTVEVFAKPRI